MPYHQLVYHFVWATRDRHPLVDESNHQQLASALRSKASELGGHIHALNLMPDHIHLVVGLPPTVTPATFVGQVKGVSSFSLARSGTPFAWQAEYGAVTVSGSNLAKAIAYVENQASHHAANTTHAPLEP